MSPTTTMENSYLSNLLQRKVPQLGFPVLAWQDLGIYFIFSKNYL